MLGSGPKGRFRSSEWARWLRLVAFLFGNGIKSNGHRSTLDNDPCATQVGTCTDVEQTTEQKSFDFEVGRNAAADEKQLRRIGFFLFVSAVSMVFTAIGFGLFGLTVGNRPREWFVNYFIIFAGRIATSYAQVRALDPTATRALSTVTAMPAVTRRISGVVPSHSVESTVRCALDDEGCEVPSEAHERKHDPKHAVFTGRGKEWSKVVRSLMDDSFVTRQDGCVGVCLLTGQRVWSQGAPIALSVPIESILKQEQPATNRRSSSVITLSEWASHRVATKMFLKKIDARLDDGTCAYFRAEIVKVDVSTLLVHLVNITGIVEMMLRNQQCRTYI